MPETDPSITPRCTHCGSDAVIPDVSVAYPVHLYLNRAPDAALNKQTVKGRGEARVCGDCGFVMVFADDPRALWDAHVERLSRQFGR